MTRKIRVCVAIGFLVALIYGLTSAAGPTPGGQASIKGDGMPGNSAPTVSPSSARLDSSLQQAPYPTNRWYTSAYTSATTYTYKMAPRPLMIDFNAKTAANGADSGCGYVMGYEYIMINTAGTISNMSTWQPSSSTYCMRVYATDVATSTPIAGTTTIMKSYSDWATTLVVKDTAHNASITTTFGSGFLFTYNQYSGNIVPHFENLQASSAWAFFQYGSSSALAASGSFNGDCIMIKAHIGNRYDYYGVYAPANSVFNYAGNLLAVTFDSSLTDSQKYISVALLYSSTGSPDDVTASSIFSKYYNYAYNFVTGTAATYSFDPVSNNVTTNFNFTFDNKRTGGSFVSNQTAFAVFPHQWRNMPLTTMFENQSFATQRGPMKVLIGNSFQTISQFKGVLPNLTYEVPAANRNTLQGYITSEQASPVADPNNKHNVYRIGKVVAKAANMIPVFHQVSDNSTNIGYRNNMIIKLETALINWYKYTSPSQPQYFGWDSVWGGILPYPNSASDGDNFGENNYNDHHFQYGYFIYASAILSLFDPAFASSSQYGGMVNMLIQDIYNPPSASGGSLHSSSFPVLRCFDVYEGHSWANGMGGGSDDGIDQESSAEAMNAWAGIILWGLATGNQDIINLGVYGYVTESAATQDYYFDVTGQIFGPPNTNYGYKSVGILKHNLFTYSTYFSSSPDQIKGIQVLPLTPSMLYLGAFPSSYYPSFYTHPSIWQDIWYRFEALFAPVTALGDFVAGGFSAEDGSSLTYSYQFINFFNAVGQVNTSYHADTPGYSVFTNNGVNTFIGFNNSTAAYKTVNFYDSGNAAAGSMYVPPLTYASAKGGNFSTLKYDSLYAMYSTNTWYALALAKYSDAVFITPSAVPPQNIYYDYLAPVFTVNSILTSTTTLYVQASNIDIPAGVNINDAKVYYFYDTMQLPDSVNIPSQSVISSTQIGTTASILIQAAITKSGTIVLAIPTGQIPPGATYLQGTVRDAQTGGYLAAYLYVYNAVTKSTDSAGNSDPGSGAYQIPFANGQYIVTPQLNGYVFQPASFPLTVTSVAISTTCDFQAYPVYSVSGNITLDNRPVDNVKVCVFDEVSRTTQTVVTSGGGNYTAQIVYSRTYIITPQSSELNFTPQFMPLIPVSANVVNVDFSASIPVGRVIAFPNPYKPAKQGSIGINFSGLAAGAQIRIYNVAGEKVFDTKVPSTGVYNWNACNNSGNRIASGVYIYFIESNGSTYKGKIAIER